MIKRIFFAPVQANDQKPRQNNPVATMASFSKKSGIPYVTITGWLINPTNRKNASINPKKKEISCKFTPHFEETITA
jgi:hypothetical protein